MGVVDVPAVIAIRLNDSILSHGCTQIHTDDSSTTLPYLCPSVLIRG